jgi:hypothetical protein
MMALALASPSLGLLETEIPELLYDLSYYDALSVGVERIVGADRFCNGIATIIHTRVCAN